MGYYDYNLRRRTADLKPYICGAVIVLLMLLVHCCAGQEQEAAAKSEAEFSIIDEARMVEVMSWQRTTVKKDGHFAWYGCAESGAVRRASMDLSRSLSALRKTS